MEATVSNRPCKVSLNFGTASRKHQESLKKDFSSEFVSFFPRAKQTFNKLVYDQNLGFAKKRRMRMGFVCQSDTHEAIGIRAASNLKETRRKRLAVFVSGGGSNFRSIHQATADGKIHGDVSVLITDKPGCGGAQYARDHGIPVVLFPKTKSSPEGVSTTDVINALKTYEVDFILLAGYLKLIPVELVRYYPKSILNIHPSLLPAFGGKGFYGLKVHQAVISSGARYSGPTIHFVDEHYDTGLILAQRVVPVLANDTPELLAARVLQEEHKVYAEAVAALCEDRIVWREDGVPLIRSRENPDEYS